MKGNIDGNTLIIGHFNIPLSAQKRSDRQKKGYKVLINIIVGRNSNQLIDQAKDRSAGCRFIW